MNVEVVELLEKFRQKTGDIRQMAQATEIKKQLKNYLEDMEYSELFIAYGRYMSGLGNVQLYDVLRKLISKYRGGSPPPLRPGKTLL